MPMEQLPAPEQAPRGVVSACRVSVCASRVGSCTEVCPSRPAVPSVSDGPPLSGVLSRAFEDTPIGLHRETRHVFWPSEPSHRIHEPREKTRFLEGFAQARSGFRRVEVRAIGKAQEGHRPSAKFGIGRRRYSDLLDAKRARQRLFDHFRLDVLAARDEAPVASPAPRQHTVLVKPSEIAGGVPSVRTGERP